MTTAVATECGYCGNALEGEELESPYTDGEDVMCDECYHDHYEFTCCLCENYGHVDDQHKLLVVCEELKNGDSGDPIKRGLYRIVNLPYWGSNYLDSWLFGRSLEHLGDAPDDVDDVYPCGHLCKECQEKVMAKIAETWAGDGI